MVSLAQWRNTWRNMAQSMVVGAIGAIKQPFLYFLNFILLLYSIVIN
jgi:hypothetical protein